MPRLRKWGSRLLFYGALLLLGYFVLTLLFGGKSDAKPQDISYSRFLAAIEAGEVSDLALKEKNTDWFVAEYALSGKPAATNVSDEAVGSLQEKLEQNGLEYDFLQKTSSFWSGLFRIVFQLLPILFIVAILFFFLRSAQGSNQQAINFGKGRARLITTQRPLVTFRDVAGVDEAKEELAEVVEFLKNPEKFQAFGARIPKGVILVGPPGCGKTLLAKAVAGEASVPFFQISGSEFVEMFVGVGASRVRDLFAQAKQNQPCIIFVDEIDAVGRHRGAGLGGGHDEREQTLNQMLVEMDGFDTSTNVIVIAATNRPDILDPALLRPGRFDRRVTVDHPDIKGRREILRVHAKGKPFEDTVDFDKIAKQTPGFSGADLANLVNEAAILAARREKFRISMREVNEAVDRVIAGAERKSKVMTPRERELVANHEAGHALVGYLLPHADPPYKISIVARGQAGGFTRFLPEEDRNFYSKSQLEDLICTALGGMAAEELVYGETSTGPQNDLARATQLARQMVTQFGMSKKLGPRTFGKRQEMIFLGREISEQRDYSEDVARTIDDEVRHIVDTAYRQATALLAEHRGALQYMVERLLEVETLEGDELEAFLAHQAAQEGPSA